MKLIVTTLPQCFEGEAAAITALFEAGLQRLQLRKPHAARCDVEQLLQQIPAVYHPRIVLHEHFDLTAQYALQGVHLNRRNPVAPHGYHGHISCSCHSIAEVAERKAHCHDVFLSPIYDSISKEGYAAAYSKAQLLEAARNGIIDARVMALGGISAEHLPEVKAIGFGGAVVLGDVWNRLHTDFIPHFEQLNRYVL